MMICARLDRNFFVSSSFNPKYRPVPAAPGTKIDLFGSLSPSSSSKIGTSWESNSITLKSEYSTKFIAGVRPLFVTLKLTVTPSLTKAPSIIPFWNLLEFILVTPTHARSADL